MIDLHSASGAWDPFVQRIKDLIDDSAVTLFIDNQHITGFSSGYSSDLDISTHCDMLLAGRLLKPQCRTVIECFLLAQRRDGQIHEAVMTAPRGGPSGRENWEKWAISPGQGDSACRLVAAAYRAWQGSGDDTWLQSQLPGLTRALEGIMNSEQRRHDGYSLIMRPFSIDHWNIQPTAAPAPGIFHGDNTSFSAAAGILAAMHRCCGQAAQERRWSAIARDSARRSMDPRLSRDKFPYLPVPPGQAANGGHWPLLGAELAVACFEHGRAADGLGHLMLYRDLLERHGRPFSWYNRDGSPGADSPEPDARGAAVMLDVMLTGLCGICDLDSGYRAVSLSPRWAMTAEKTVRVRLSYADSGAGFGYRWQHDPAKGSIQIDLKGETGEIRGHVLLPGDARPRSARLDGKKIPFQPQRIGADHYVDFLLDGGMDGGAQVELAYNRP